VDAGVAGIAGMQDAPEPPRLVCETGTQVTPAPAPEPAWYCARPDGTKHGAFITVFPDQTIEVRGTYKDGVLDGPWERHHPTGAIMLEGSYAGGQKTGRWRQSNPNGTTIGEYELVAGSGVEKRWYDEGPLYSELTLKAGIPNGPAKFYTRDGVVIDTMRYANGKLDGSHAFGTRGAMRFEETFVNGVLRGSRKVWLGTLLIADENYDRRGKLDGPYTSWRAPKIMRVTGQFTAGKRTGAWLWNDRDGKKEREGSYVTGKRDGAWNEYNADKPTFTGTYDVGKPNGDFIYYDRNGNELGRYTIADGTGVALTFHANRKPASKQRLVQGTESGVYQELTPRGKLVTEGRFAGGVKHGSWKEWTADGVPTLQQSWKRGKLDGVVKKFVDGKPSLEAHYADGKATGTYAEYRLGKPSVTGQFADDLRTGTWTHYNAEGAVVLIATYKNGVLDGPWRELVGDPPSAVVLEGQMTAGRRSGTWTRTDKAGAVRKLTYQTP
jgi:antitoxin component YwqK of YwqJK toxin-antitoxin module